jgi:hypothetical protein
MTSKTLSAKRNVPLGIFLWGLKKNSVLMIIGTVLAFLASPGFLLAGYFRSVEENALYGYNSVFDPQPYSLAGEVLIALGAIGLVVLFTAMNQRHLHSKKAADLWGALPITHGGLVLTRALTVLVSTILPVTISYIGKIAVCLLIPELGLGWMSALYAYGFVLLFIFICTGMATLFAVVCGNTFDMIASLLVINGGWPAVVAIFTSQASELLTGYVAGSSFEQFFLLSPFARAVTHPFFDLNPMDAAVHYTLWGGFGLLMFAAAFLLCRVRKNECSGSSYAYTALPVACQCAVGICCGFVTALIFTLGNLSARDGGINLSFYCFFVIGTLLGVMIYGAIVSRGFKTVLRSLLTGGIVAAVSLGTVTAMAFGGFGFETRLPSEKLVESVRFNASYLSNYEDVVFTEPEDIHAVYALHSRIVEDIRNGDYGEDTDSHTSYDALYPEDSPSLYSYEITYTLSAGQTMARRYQLSESRYGEALRQILASDIYLEATEPVFHLGDSEFSSHSFELSGWSGGYLELTRDEARQLAEAYRRDLEAVTPESYAFDEEYLVNAYPVGGGYSELSDGALMRIKSNYSESMAYLNESGILGRMDDADDKYAYDYTDENGVHHIS